MPKENDLEKTMLNVRRAYRFLAEFTSRLQDIIKVMQDEFQLDYYRWEPYFNVVRSGRSSPVDRLSWAGFPLYNFNLLYLSSKSEQQLESDSWMLEIAIDLDDGVEKHDSGDLPDPTKFTPVDDVESGIYLIVYRCNHAASDSLDWYRAWQGLDYVDPYKPKKVQPMKDEKGNEFSTIFCYKKMEELGNKKNIQDFCRNAKGTFKDKLKVKIA